MRKVKKVFREGLPRITEPIFAQSGYRDTGFYGTGIYAYRDLEATDQKSKDVYELETPELILLSACLPDLREIADQLYSYLDKDSEMELFSEEHDKLRQALSNIEKMNGDIDFTETDLRDAIRKAKACVKKHGDMECALPINHLIRMRGFHGIYPLDCRNKMVKEKDQWVRKYVINEDNAVNSNAYGIVIFKQDKDQIKSVKRIN